MKTCKKCGKEIDEVCRECYNEYKKHWYKTRKTSKNLYRTRNTSEFVPEFPRLPGETFNHYCRRYNETHPWKFEFAALSHLIDCRNAPVVHRS